MRKTKFRGICINKGEFEGKWAYGDLLQKQGKTYICPQANSVRVTGEIGKLLIMHEVKPETVGEYTGVTYRGGVEVYEGDIVEIEYFPDLPTTRDYENLAIRTVCEFGADASFHLRGLGAVERNSYAIRFGGSAVKRKEIIGNRWDNPELLGGESHG